MKTIAVTLDKWESTLPCGNITSPKGWMASFLDFQISKLEERCVEIREGIDATLPEINPNPVWN